MGGILWFPEGRTSALRPVTDPEWVEQWMRRSVQPMGLWTLTVPLLPVGENLTAPFGITVPLLGVDEGGRTIAVLFDLRTERPLPTVLGEGLMVLQWAEGLDKDQLETFGRYFWHDPKASLAGVWAKVYGRSGADISFGHRAQVHILSWRSLPLLWDIQSFLNHYNLAILFFGLHTLQGEQGEVVALTEPMGGLTGMNAGAEAVSVVRVGEAETFLRSLEGAP